MHNADAIRAQQKAREAYEATKKGNAKQIQLPGTNKADSGATSGPETPSRTAARIMGTRKR